MFEEEQVWSGLPVTIEFLSCSQVLLCYPSSRRSELSSAPRFSHRGLPWLGTPRWTDLSRSSCQWWSRRVLRMVSQTRSTPAAQLPRVGQPLSWSSTINHSQWDTVRHCETLWDTDCETLWETPTLSLALHLVLVGCPAARTNVSRHLCLHIFLLCGHYSGSRLTWSWWLDPEIFSDLTLPVTMICFVWRNHLVRAESCYPGESQSRTETGGKRAWLHPSPHSHHRRSPVSLIWPRQCWWWCILLAIV